MPLSWDRPFNDIVAGRSPDAHDWFDPARSPDLTVGRIEFGPSDTVPSREALDRMTRIAETPPIADALTCWQRAIDETFGTPSVCLLHNQPHPCGVCSSVPQHITDRPGTFQPIPQQGWQCPTCKAGVAPWQSICPACKPTPKVNILDFRNGPNSTTSGA